MKYEKSRVISLITPLAFAVSFACLVSVAQAAPLYAPGQTLDPTCLPTDPDCTVTPPAASGANSDITQLSALTAATSTDFTVSNQFQALTGWFTNLAATNATSTNFFATNANLTNVVLGSATTTNLFATIASSTSLFTSVANLGSLNVSSTTTLASSLNGILSAANGVVSATTSPTFDSITTASTTATSTFAGNVQINGNLSGIYLPSQSQYQWYNYVAWGDSLTYGNQDTSGVRYPGVLASLLGATVNNMGVSGNTSTQIAVREGGVPTTATISGGVIPAFGGVTVTFLAGYEPITYQGPSAGVLGTIGGVQGIVTASSSIYTFTRTTPGTAVSTSSASFIVSTPHLGNFTIIWAGRNNFSNPSQVESDIAAMISILPPPKRFLVMSITNQGDPTEYIGQPSYNQIIGINNYLASTYPNNYLDIRSYLMSTCNPIGPSNTTGWYASTTQDVIDCGNGVPPTSIRYDAIHFNQYGYTIIANKVASWLQANDPGIGNHPLATKDIQSIFASPPPIGTTTPDSLVSVIGNLNLNTNASGSGVLFSNFNPAYALGGNLFIGGGGQVSVSSSTSTTLGSFNTAMGINALQSNTTGSYNVANGYGALINNATGSNDVANGYTALGNNTSGLDNVAVGYAALYANTAGNYNVADGYASLSSNTTGSFNVADGMYSLFNNTTGIYDTAGGYKSLYHDTTGSENTGDGYTVLFNNTTGSYNTAYGYGTASTLNGGSKNTFLGYGADTTAAASTTLTNSTAIGNGAIVTASNQMVFGSTSVMQTLLNGNVGIGTSTPASTLDVGGNITDESVKTCDSSSQALGTTASGTLVCDASLSDERLKTDITSLDATDSLNLIDTLNPVSFYWIDPTIPGTGSTQEQFGFIAQQVDQVAPNLVATTTPTYLTPDQTYYLNYQGIIAPLVAAIQAQQGEIVAASSSVVQASATLSSLSDQLQEYAVALANATTTLSAQVTALASTTTELTASLASTTATIASSTAATLSNSFIQTIATAAESLIQSTGNWIINQVTAATGVFNNLTATTATVQTLCVGSTCVTEAQLQQLLQKEDVTEDVRTVQTTQVVTTATTATSTATSSSSTDASSTTATTTASSNTSTSTSSLATSTSSISTTSTSTGSTVAPSAPPSPVSSSSPITSSSSPDISTDQTTSSLPSPSSADAISTSQ